MKKKTLQPLPTPGWWQMALIVSLAVRGSTLRGGSDGLDAKMELKVPNPVPGETLQRFLYLSGTVIRLPMTCREPFTRPRNLAKGRRYLTEGY